VRQRLQSVPLDPAIAVGPPYESSTKVHSQLNIPVDSASDSCDALSDSNVLGGRVEEIGSNSCGAAKTGQAAALSR